jgi:hypothetical protein
MGEHGPGRAPTRFRGAGERRAPGGRGAPGRRRSSRRPWLGRFACERRRPGGFADPSFDGPNGRGHGSVRTKHGRFVQFDVPGAISTIGNKINDGGQIVGGFNETGISMGAPGSKRLLFHRGRFTTINVPGSMETQALGIDNLGRVVGEYVDAAGSSTSTTAARSPVAGPATTQAGT